MFLLFFYYSIVHQKVTLVQALRLCTGRTAHRGSRGIALPFHDHGTRRGWGISVTPWPLFTPGKTRYPLYMRLGGPQGRSGQVQKIWPAPGFDPGTVQPVASGIWGVVFISAALHNLIICLGKLMKVNPCLSSNYEDTLASFLNRWVPVMNRRHRKAIHRQVQGNYECLEAWYRPYHYISCSLGLTKFYEFYFCCMECTPCEASE